MKYFNLLYLLCLSLFISCSEDNSSIVETEDVTLSNSYISFEENSDEKTLTINVKENTYYSWRISKLRNRDWLTLSTDTGRGTKIISLKVDRNKMDFGLNYDTLEIRFSKISKGDNLQGLKDSVKKIPITAAKAPYYADIIKSYLGNEVQLTSTYLDSTFCLLGSFRVQTDNAAINTAIGTFYANNTAFADAGSSVVFKAKTGIPVLVNVDLQKFSFSFTGSNSQTISGYYYMPQTGTYADSKSNFDDTTYHSFNIAGASSGYSQAFIDSILSVTMPNWSNQQTNISSTSALTINWLSTNQPNDYVFAVIVSATDTTKRVITNAPVEDIIGTLSFDSQKLSTIKQAGSSAYLYLVRYRIKTDSIRRTIILCQAQRRYSMTIL